MFRFCDGGAKTIRRTKGTNEFDIVVERMLPRKIEIETNTSGTEDFAMMMKLLKGIV